MRQDDVTFVSSLCLTNLHGPIELPKLSGSYCLNTVRYCTIVVLKELLTKAASYPLMANERLRALEDVEKEIAMILQCAGKNITHQMLFSLTFYMPTHRMRMMVELHFVTRRH